MKNKVFALAFSMLFFGSITATSYAQVVTSSNLITVVDNDKDKTKTNNKKKSGDSKSCKDKKSCCDHKVVLKDDSCKDKKSDKDKK